MQIICDADSDEAAEKYIGLLAEGMNLLKYDYLGGSGSRGYGRVRFIDLDVKCVYGEINEAALDNCRRIMKGVESE